jgi:hypothetical protein
LFSLSFICAETPLHPLSPFFFKNFHNAPVTLSRFVSPIRPDLKIGIDRGSVWVVARSGQVGASRDESGAAKTG